jgi:sugar/nucleoside kinase (ribokinase family)
VYTASLIQAEQRTKHFDVICVGQALWKLTARGGASNNTSSGVQLQPGGGPVNIALALAGEGLRVGLTTVLADDSFGRGSFERIAESGVDVGGVSLARPRPGFVRVDASGSAAELTAQGDNDAMLEVPPGWAARVLLLSGLSPVVPHAAALCKAARAARRRGSVVVIDFNASFHEWAGRDPRTIQMVLREVDVARCSLADLAVLGTDAAAVRAALRANATLVVGDGAGGAVATGAFGEVAFVPPAGTRLRASGVGDACTAAICAELSRVGVPGESVSARWFRALRRGCAVATMRG